MCYQLPGSITVDGDPIIGGIDINSTDAAFAARIYPKTGLGAGAQPQRSASADSYAKHFQADDWPEGDDVSVDELALT
jgi:hypothetical protein